MNGCLKSTFKVISNSATTSSSSPVSVCWKTTSASRKTCCGWRQLSRKRKRRDRPQPRMARLETWLLIAPLLVTELSRRGAGLARQRRPLAVKMRRTQHEHTVLHRKSYSSHLLRWHPCATTVPVHQPARLTFGLHFPYQRHILCALAGADRDGICSY